MRVLFIVPYPPSQLRVRPYNLIKHLTQRGHRVTVLTLWTTEQEWQDVKELELFCEQVVVRHLPRHRSLRNCVRALPTTTPLQAVYCLQPELVKLIPAFRAQADLVHVEHLRGAPYALQAAHWRNGDGARKAVVWDSVDCISHLFGQASQTSRSLKGRLMTSLELGRTRRYEGCLVGQFERTLVSSRIDKQALATLRRDALSRNGGLPQGRDGGETIQVVPNGVDQRFFAPADERREPATLVITGKMSYHANITAVLHLLDNIMPLVWAKRPDVNLWIVGQDPPTIIRTHATRAPKQAASRGGVLVTGTVPDIRPYLRRATVAVAPIPYGAGIQNKVLEAMACETAVIATSQAAAGLSAEAGRDLLMADEAPAFARAILELLADPARRARLGRAGREYVERQHSWEQVVTRLEFIYEDAIAAATLPRILQE